MNDPFVAIKLARKYRAMAELYRDAIAQAKALGLNIPTVIQLADAVNFPEAR